MNGIKKFLIAVLTVPAILTALPAVAQAVSYTITSSLLSATGTGTISPTPTVSVNSGANQTFTMTAGTGYAITSLSIDNTIQATPTPTAQSNVFQYAFNNVTAPHSIGVYYWPSDPNDGAPQIQSQPQSMSVSLGATATFTVTANGLIDPSYRWYKSTNGGATFTSIVGANSASYTTPATIASDNATEFVCEVFNDYAFVSTNVATLTVVVHPYVKVQGRQLVADFTGNGNYQPYVIRGVDYSPTPIGRYSSDWGYYATPSNPNPNNLNPNILADTNILNRDFTLLKGMNANTIRIWQGDNTLGVGPNYVTEATFENAFPLQAFSYGDNIYTWLENNGYLTVVNGEGQVPSSLDLTSSTNLNPLQAEFTDAGEYNIVLNILRLAQKGDVSTDIGRFPNMLTAATLNTAAANGLKVIAGFAVGAFGSCNYLTNPCTYSLNIYNAISNDPGLNTGFDLTNSYIRSDILMRFENYVNTFKNNPNILFWAIGNENNLSLNTTNAAQVKAWYSLVNQMAQAAHQIEGASYHPVAVVNGDIQFIGQSTYGADDNSLPNVDIWGANTYRGQSFNDYFIQYKALSSKPFWISEYGVDSWQSCNTANPANCDPNDPAGTASAPAAANQPANDEADQATWDGGLWDEIAGNGDITIGASVMEYSDEWWKPYDWICTYAPYSSYGSASYCQSHHFYFGEGIGSGWPLDALAYSAPTPDHYFNEAWFGLMGISNNAPQYGPDTMTPRQAYTTLQGKFASNAALASYLASPVQGTTLNSATVTFAWSLGRGVTQYELYIGTTSGAANVYSYTGTATSAVVSGIPLNSQLLYVQLGSFINGAWQTKNYTYATVAASTNTITASAGSHGTISPSGAVKVSAGANQTFTVTPSAGYGAQLTVDGVAAVLTNNTYTFTNVTIAHTIAVNFVIPAIVSASPFGPQTFSFSLPITVTTNENMTCKYQASSGAPGPPSTGPSYASLPNTFATTGGTVHTQWISTLGPINALTSYQYYYVICMDQSGNVTANNYAIGFIVSPPPVPSAPTLSVALSADGKHNVLSWTASSAGQGIPLVYVIYRVLYINGKDVGSFQEIYGGMPSLTWTDMAAQSGITYQYEVRAVDSIASTQYSTSNIVAATTPKTYAITASAVPTVYGSVAYACTTPNASPCASPVLSGTVVTFTETPHSGYTFGSWAGVICNGQQTGSTCVSPPINANTTVTASFTAIVPGVVSAAVVAPAVSNPVVPSCRPSTCIAVFQCGSTTGVDNCGNSCTASAGACSAGNICSNNVCVASKVNVTVNQIATQCSAQSLVVNDTTASFPNISVGSSASGACASGSGSAAATCGSNGIWGNVLGTCCNAGEVWNGSICVFVSND